MLDFDFDELIESWKIEISGLAKTGEQPPYVMVFHQGKDPRIYVLAGRQNIHLQLQQLLKLQQPDAYVYTGEARFRFGDSHIEQVGEIADSPKLPEFLLIVGAPRGGRVRVWMANILPSENRAACRRGERKIGDWKKPPHTLGPLLIENW